MANSKSNALVKTNKKEVAVQDPEILAELRGAFPNDPSALRIQLPRLSMLSQDKKEESGKGKEKKIKVVEAAGTFFIERQTDEVEEGTGNRKWSREEIGDSVEAIILFQRKQLRMYDEDTEQYTSSPIFDSGDEVIPLFCDRKEVARGTAAELKAKYQYKDEKDGKTKSKLEDNKILYVLIEDEVYQLNLRGSSMFSYMTFARKVSPPTVLVRLSSEEKEKGTINWNQMTFEPIRPLNNKELKSVLEKVNEIKDSVVVEKASFASVQSEREAADAKFRKEVGNSSDDDDDDIPVIDGKERRAKF